MLTVSNYHYIREDFKTPFPSIFGVTPQSFKNQLLLFKNQADFLSAADLVADINEILNSKNNYFFITFDDGLKEQYQLALPILDELNIPAVFFVNSINHIERKLSTVHKIHLLRSIVSSEILYRQVQDFTGLKLGNKNIENAHSFYRFDEPNAAELKYFLNVFLNIEKQKEFVDDLFKQHFDEIAILEKLYMSHKELQHIASKNYLGSHTHSHLPLGLYNDEDIERELTTTKAHLENTFSTAIELVSYPYGTREVVTKNVAKLAKEAGYKIGFTTMAGTNNHLDELLLLNRFDCNDLAGGKNYIKH